MKKIFTLFAAMTLLASAGFAQSAHRHVALSKAERNATVAPRLVRPNQTISIAKAAGDTVSTFPWTEGFESTTLVGFTFVDADNDGDNWTVETERVTAHTGNGVIRSASWSQTTEEALMPDNWMILPAMQIPTDGSEFNLSWWTIGQDANYADEHYSVYVCTAGRTVADFTATAPVHDGYATANYVRNIVDLGSYAGQVVYIAFRHWNVTDQFWLNIDDIRVGGAEPPVVTLEGPAAVEMNTSATFTASGASTFTWTVDGDAQTETGATLSYTFTTMGNHTVIASATNSAGTGSDSIIVNVYDCSAAITAMPWGEDFEGNTDCWRFVTVDETSTGFSISAQGYGHNGSTNCLFGSYSDDSDVDQWAISPMVTLPANADNYILKFYAYTLEYEGVQSHYEVRLTTVADPETSDFTVLLHNETSATSAFAPHIVSLGEYAGQTIRIAFRNITAQEGDAMLIDDIYIGEPLPPDMTVAGPVTAIKNEPATFEAITDASSVVWSIDGTVLSETGLTLSHTFTAAGTFTVKATATNNAGSSSDSIVVEVVDCGQTITVPHTFNLATEFNLCWNNPEEGWDTINLDGDYYLYSMSNLYGIFDLDPDNWVYTPAISMPAEGSYEISWKVMPYAAELPSDHYGVYLVQGDNATLLREETLGAAITAPSNRVARIPDGVTGEFKVAFRHFNTTGGYVILVSDIQVAAAGTTVGIEEVENGQVAVYPNPANDMIVVEAENASLVQVLDVNGRVVLSAERAGRMDVSGLAAGVYVVRVVAESGVSTTKIVKE